MLGLRRVYFLGLGLTLFIAEWSLAQVVSPESMLRERRTRSAESTAVPPRTGAAEPRRTSDAWTQRFRRAAEPNRTRGEANRGGTPADPVRQLASLGAKPPYAASTNGRRLVATERDGGNLSIWDLPTRSRLRRLEGSRSSYARLTISPDGRWVAAAVDNASGRIELWRTDTGRRQKSLGTAGGAPSELRFASSGDELLVYFADGSGVALAVPSGEELRGLRRSIVAGTRQTPGIAAEAQPPASDPSGEEPVASQPRGSRGFATQPRDARPTQRAMPPQQEPQAVEARPAPVPPDFEEAPEPESQVADAPSGQPVIVEGPTSTAMPRDAVAPRAVPRMAAPPDVDREGAAQPATRTPDVFDLRSGGGGARPKTEALPDDTIASQPQSIPEAVPEPERATTAATAPRPQAAISAESGPDFGGAPTIDLPAESDAATPDDVPTGSAPADDELTGSEPPQSIGPAAPDEPSEPPSTNSTSAATSSHASPAAPIAPPSSAAPSSAAPAASAEPQLAASAPTPALSSVKVHYATNRNRLSSAERGWMSYFRGFFASLPAFVVYALVGLSMLVLPWFGKPMWALSALLSGATLCLAMAAVEAQVRSQFRDELSGERFGSRPTDLSYGVCEISVPRPENRRKGEVNRPVSVWVFEAPENPDKHFVLRKIDEHADKDAFYASLSEHLQASNSRDALLFIHGYNVSFEDAVFRTAQLTVDLGFQGSAMTFSWPSYADPVKYTFDEQNAEVSVPALREFLEDLAARSGAKKIHIIAHSMGNRVLAGALEGLKPETLAAHPTIFQEVVLAAPDIDTRVFRTQVLPHIARVARHCTLYASSNDRALLISRAFHNFQRLGESAPEPLVERGIDTIDASQVDTSLLGHSYIGDAQSIVADLQALVVGGKRPPERIGLETLERGDLKYWTIRR